MQQVQTAAELEVRLTQWQAKNRRLDAKRATRRARAVKMVVIALLAAVLIFRREATISDAAVTGPLGLAVVLATIAIFAVAAAQTKPLAAVSRAGAR